MATEWNVKVADVKNYLKIPYDDDDSIIEGMLTDAYDYLADAVDDFEDLYTENERFSRKADNWVLHYYMPDAYDQREGGYDGRREKMNYPGRSIITQLQRYRKKESE